jgi:hypothetical protein
MQNSPSKRRATQSGLTAQDTAFLQGWMRQMSGWSDECMHMLVEEVWALVHSIQAHKLFAVLPAYTFKSHEDVYHADCVDLRECARTELIAVAC